MKKILLILIGIVIPFYFINYSFSYTLTQEEKNLVNNLTQKIENFITKKGERTRPSSLIKLKILSKKYKNYLKIQEIINQIAINIEASQPGKIHNAYISDEIKTVGEKDYFNNVSQEAKKNIKNISGTNYYLSGSNIYYDYWGNLNEVNGITSEKIYGLLPFKGFIGNTDFVTDGDYLFFYGNKINNGDIHTLKFKKGENNYLYNAGDKNNLYLSNNTILEGGDIISLEKLSDICYKDNKDVYCMFGDFGGAKFNIIKGVDINTFSEVKNFWYKDKNNMYYGDNKIGDIDVNTFEIINDYYIKDKNGVYYNGEKIEGANPHNFSLSGGLY